MCVKTCRCGGAQVELAAGDDLPVTCGAADCGAAIDDDEREHEEEPESAATD